MSILGGIILFFLIEENIASEIYAPQTCLAASLCHLLRGDLHREFGEPQREYYENAQYWLDRHLKNKKLGPSPMILQECEANYKHCKEGIVMDAKMKYKELGLRPGVFDDCSEFRDWSLPLFLCENIKLWPKGLREAMPSDVIACNSTCNAMKEIEQFHLKNGKAKNDFPLNWGTLMAVAQSSKEVKVTPRRKLIKTRRNSTVASPVDAAPETRQSSRITERDPSEIIETLTFGDEMQISQAFGPVMCPQGYWINYVEEYLPKTFHFSCINGEGVRYPRDHNLVIPTESKEQLSDLELENEKFYNLEPTRAINCEKNKFKRYQDKYPFLTGVEFIISERRLVGGTYLCAGDNIWTLWTKQPVHNLTFQKERICPLLSAICSIMVREKFGHGIIFAKFGCCSVPEKYLSSNQVFNAAPYQDLTQDNSRPPTENGEDPIPGDWPFDKKYSILTGYYPWMFAERTEIQTWICPANTFVQDIDIRMVVPSPCSEPCKPLPFIFFLHKVMCVHVGLGTAYQMDVVNQLWDDVWTNGDYRGVFKSHIKCPKGSVFDAGRLSFSKGVLRKEFQCANAGIGSSGEGAALTETPVSPQLLAPPGSLHEIEEFRVGFMCPPATFLCGFGTRAGKRRKEDDLRYNYFSVEGVYTDHLCCPPVIDYCDPNTIEFELEPIDTRCSGGLCDAVVPARIAVKTVNDENIFRIERMINAFGMSQKAKEDTKIRVDFIASGIIDLALSHPSTREKTKLYRFLDAFPESNSAPVPTFRAPAPFQQLLTFSPYLHCGGYKVNSRWLVQLKIPQKDCKISDRLEVFHQVDTGPVAREITVFYTGVGAKLVTGTDATHVHIPYSNFNLKDRFNNYIGERTGVHWGKVPIRTWEQYEINDPYSFKYKLSPNSRTWFYRTVGLCGSLKDGTYWEIFPPVNETAPTFRTLNSFT